MSAVDGPLLAVTCPTCGVMSILDHDALVDAIPALAADRWLADRLAVERVKQEKMREANARLLAEDPDGVSTARN